MKRLLLLILFLVMVVPVMGQDATAETTVEANPVTVIDGEGGDIDVIVAPPAETPVDPAEPWYAKYLAQLIALGIAAGTLLYGVLKAANKWLEGKKTDVGAMSGAEWAYRRSPAWLKKMIVELIKEFVRLGGNLNEVLAEVEDDVAFATKQATRPNNTTTTSGGYTSTVPPQP